MSVPSRFYLTVLVALVAASAFADSQARIVRLSDVQGSVQIDKNTGVGFESAFLNLPITQGTQLKTGEKGRAEIEFEDGSTIRLAPNSTVQFSALGSNDAGIHLSTVDLVEGMAYVNWLGKSGDQINLNFSREKVSLTQSAHFRVATATDQSKLAVFKGDVEVDAPSGKVTVTKKKTATFSSAENDQYTVANKLEEEPLDSWDKESISYHDQYAKNNSSPYGYGSSDLNYYGNYTNVPGYGMMWQPYFTGVGWDPFMDGAWSFYPGQGYMFVSAYPWGWMPYRYGNWMFVPGFGWMWQPGTWNTWVAVPRYTAPATVHVTALVPPTAGTVKTVTLGKGGYIAPSTPGRLVVNSGTAGLGIARGSISNMPHLNTQVARNGSAQVHTAPQFATSSPRPSSGGFSAPHSTMSAPSMGHASSAGHTSAPPSHH